MDVIDTVITVRSSEALEKAIARDTSVLDDKDELSTLIDTLSVEYPQQTRKRQTIVDVSGQDFIMKD